MSNFWSVLGAAAGATAGAIIDEMDRQNRPNVTVRFVERPAVRVRVSAPVETVRIKMKVGAFVVNDDDSTSWIFE